MRLLEMLKLWTAFIYDLFISNFLTIAAHVAMMPHITPSHGTFLDVGCGTGAPLSHILPQLKKSYSEIVGVDLDSAYTEQAKKIFEKEDDVTIYTMNFYEINNILPGKKYDFILFSFSFMLMPDPVKALRLATECLKPNGRIAFVMTLNPVERPWLEKLKPLIYRLTSVDFGNVVYEKQFEEILRIASLKIEKKHRLNTGINLMLKLFPVHYIETTLAA